MAKTRNPIQERGVETKLRILEAGFASFSLKGLHGTNSREIAAAAGVSIGTFYTYFKDKRQLFIELIHTHCGKILNVLETFQVQDHLGKEPREVVRTLICAVWELHDSVYPLNQKAMALRQMDPEIDRIIAEQEEAILRRLLSVLQAAQAKLRIRDMQTAARLVGWIIEGVMFSAHRANLKADNQQLLEELVDLVSRYLFA
jgi:AcrR family transcriptional regulator